MQLCFFFFCSASNITESNLMLKFGETNCLTLRCNLLLIDFCIILQLLPATEDLPSAQGGSLTQLLSLWRFSRQMYLGAQGFPGLSCLFCKDMQIEPPASDCALHSPSQIANCGGSQLFSCAHVRKIKLDRLQEPVSSVWVFHGRRQEIRERGLSFASQPHALK